MVFLVYGNDGSMINHIYGICSYIYDEINIVMLCPLCCDVEDDVVKCEEIVEKNYRKTTCKRKGEYYCRAKNKFYCELHYKPGSVRRRSFLNQKAPESELLDSV